jgi:hypothetical protein
MTTDRKSSRAEGARALLGFGHGTTSEVALERVAGSDVHLGNGGIVHRLLGRAGGENQSAEEEDGEGRKTTHGVS